MKKFVKFFVAMAILVSGFLATSCDDLKKEFEGPKDKWLEKQVSYSKTDGGVSASATVYLYYTDDDEPEIEKLNSDITIHKGLNIFFVPEEVEAGDTVSTLYSTLKASLNNDKEPYAYFCLAKDKETSISDDMGTKAYIMNDALWSTFCTLNPSTKASATTDIPYPLSRSSFAAVDVSKEEIKALFSWRKLLIMLLAD